MWIYRIHHKPGKGTYVYFFSLNERAVDEVCVSEVSLFVGFFTDFGADYGIGKIFLANFRIDSGFPCGDWQSHNSCDDTLRIKIFHQLCRSRRLGQFAIFRVSEICETGIFADAASVKKPSARQLYRFGILCQVGWCRI